MVVTINGHTLSNSIDLFLYYKQFSGTDLMTDLTKRSKKLQGLAQDDIIANLEDFDIVAFTKNLYYAGRCAAEDRLIPESELKSELTVDVLLNADTMQNLMALVVGENSQKKRLQHKQ